MIWNAGKHINSIKKNLCTKNVQINLENTKYNTITVKNNSQLQQQK